MNNINDNSFKATTSSTDLEVKSGTIFSSLPVNSSSSMTPLTPTQTPPPLPPKTNSTPTPLSASSSFCDLQSTFFGANFSNFANSSNCLSPTSIQPPISPKSPKPEKRGFPKTSEKPSLFTIQEHLDETLEEVVPTVSSVKKPPSSFSTAEASDVAIVDSSKILKSFISERNSYKPISGTSTSAELRLNKIFQLAEVIETLLQEGLATEFVQGLVGEFRALLDAHVEAKDQENEKEVKEGDFKKMDVDLTIEKYCEAAWGFYLMRISQLKSEEKKKVMEEEKQEQQKEFKVKSKKSKGVKFPPQLPSEKNFANFSPVVKIPSFSEISNKQHSSTENPWFPKLAPHDGKLLSFPVFWKTLQLNLANLETDQDQYQALLSAVHPTDSVAIVAEGTSSVSGAELFLKRKYLSPKAVREVIQERLTKLQKIRSNTDVSGLQALRDFLDGQVTPLVELMHVEAGNGYADFCGYGPKSKLEEVAIIFDLLHNVLPKSLGSELSKRILGEDFSKQFMDSDGQAGPRKELSLLSLFIDEVLLRLRKAEMATRGGGLVRRLVATFPRLQRHFASNSEAAEAKAKKVVVAEVSKKISGGDKKDGGKKDGKKKKDGGVSAVAEVSGAMVTSSNINESAIAAQAERGEGFLFGFSNQSCFKFGESTSTDENEDEDENDGAVEVDEDGDNLPKADSTAAKEKIKMEINPLYDFVMVSEPTATKTPDIVSTAPTVPTTLAAKPSSADKFSNSV